MEPLKHECGVAMIRLLKPLEYYAEKYGSEYYALNQMYLMMEKQHNRGQEGAGIACVKMNQKPGHEYMFREKATGKDAITKIFDNIRKQIYTPDEDDPLAGKPFLGEMYMGHLRYSTTSKKGLKYVHPFLRRDNWRAKNLCICGNFNMTNVDEVFQKLTAQGQYPRILTDSYIMLEHMGHRLDREAERNFVEAQNKGLTGLAVTDYIDSHMNMANVLKTSMQDFDGGYVICGLTGSGEMFSMRDPNGIRPAFYFKNDDIVAVASERAVLQTAFNVSESHITELCPGQALIVNAKGNVILEQILPKQEYKACSFERIYFSRGNDRDIYNERKQLGRLLVPDIVKAVDGDIDHTVFSFIPNTAEVAYYGMVEALREQYKNVRAEKVVWKDIKLRTFITEGDQRNDLASHVYDITAGSLEPEVDNLVVIDDSIVRGTTLRESIIRILSRLKPKKIVIVSSAPQIRYPDYYGIDMSYLSQFIAFQACITLIKERGMEQLLHDTYKACVEELKKPAAEMHDMVRYIYEPFTAEELNNKMVELLRPEDIDIPIQLVFQSLDGLHKAIPNHPGDWYFSGHFPTPGGKRLVNQAYIDFYTKYTQK